MYSLLGTLNFYINDTKEIKYKNISNDISDDVTKAEFIKDRTEDVLSTPMEPINMPHILITALGVIIGILVIIGVV